MAIYHKPEKDINKDLLIEQFKKIPIVQIACEKVGVARSSYYRWRKDDPEFAEKADQALVGGRMLINELAESQLVSLIQERNLGAIRFWLSCNDKNYKNKVEVSGNIKTETKLSPDQEDEIVRALKLAKLVGKNNKVKEDADSEDIQLISDQHKQ
jgi:hypothetical protein